MQSLLKTKIAIKHFPSKCLLKINLAMTLSMHNNMNSIKFQFLSLAMCNEAI